MDIKEHWESIYESKADSYISWTQSEPQPSLSLIEEISGAAEVIPAASTEVAGKIARRIIDVGGGTSILVDRLIDSGYSVTVLDISQAAIARAQTRLGERSSSVHWVASDVTLNPDLAPVDIWHDRAVFHFLTNAPHCAAYIELLNKTLVSGGHVILATFAPDGPKKCSGLPVQRYDGLALEDELGDSFSRIKTVPAIHKTPWGHPQSFQYSIFHKL